MNADTPAVREIGFPLRLGELTLARPTRRLVPRQVSILADPAPMAELLAEPLPPEADGYLIGRPAPVTSQTSAPAPNGYIRWVMHRGPRYFVRLEGTFEEYLSRFSSKTRSGLRRKQRRLEREAPGPVRFAAFGPGGFHEFYDGARSVSRVTYQEIMFDAGLPESGEAARAIERGLESGQARGFLLSVGDMPVAYMYCPRRDDVYEYQYVGFRPDFGHLSPGTVLLLMALEHLFNEGDAKALDFTEGGGQGSHKAFHATDSVDFETVVLLRRCLRNRVLVTARRSVDGLSGLIGGLLERLGLKQRVRELLRRARGVPGAATAP